MKSDMSASTWFRLIPIVMMLVSSVITRGVDIIYDNSAAGGTNVYYSTVEFGDEVTLGGSVRVMSQFMFEYYGDFTASGNKSARVRIYRGDGPLTAAGDPTPGTLLYDSEPFEISPGYQTKTFSGLSVNLPNGLIWTIEFGGLTGAIGDRAGLIFRDPPTVGSSFDDFWSKANGKWQLFRFDGRPVANFAARIVSGGAGTRVAIRRDTGKVIVEWSGLSILQVADAAAGPFTDLPSIRNRYEINATIAGMKFWRLRD